MTDRGLTQDERMGLANQMVAMHQAVELLQLAVTQLNAHNTANQQDVRNSLSAALKALGTSKGTIETLARTLRS